MGRQRQGAISLAADHGADAYIITALTLTQFVANAYINPPLPAAGVLDPKRGCG
jgi:hypothetical protein